MQRQPRLKSPPLSDKTGELTTEGNYIVFRRQRVGHIHYLHPKGQGKQWYATANDGRRTENVSSKWQALVLFHSSQFLEPLV